jgi:hypothetical protein
MMSIVILSTLVGAAFGLRFQLFALGVAIWLSVALIIAAGIANGDSAWSIVTFAALIAGMFQIGYLGGSLARFTITPTRSIRFRAVVSRSAFGGRAK